MRPMSRVWVLLALAVASALAAVAVYAIALGTGRGIEVDEAAMLRGWNGLAFPQVHDAVSGLVHSIDAASLVLAAAGLAALALLRARPWDSLAAVAMIAGPLFTTEYLKPRLGSADPLGGEPFRIVHGIFPSGHATIAMSLALALVFVAPPASRMLAAAAGAVYAGAVGVGLVALGAHYPSDVLGGFLVAASWASLVAAGSTALQRADGGGPVLPPDLVEQAKPLAAALAALAMGIAGYLLISHAHQLEFYGRVHTSFFAAAAAIFGAAILLTGLLALALGALRPWLGRPA